jgi:integrase
MTATDREGQDRAGREIRTLRVTPAIAVRARTQAFNSDFKLRAQKAGVPVIPIHATRRTCASLLVALDVHPRVAMAVLRHSWIALTMEVYSQVSSTSTRDALKRLEAENAGHGTRCT